MATAETDLDKPSGVVCKKRSVGIIHPDRFVKVKPISWTRIFGSHKTYIDTGDITKAPTQKDIADFIVSHNVAIVRYI